MAGSDFRQEAPKSPFLRRRSENMSKILLTYCHITKCWSLIRNRGRWTLWRRHILDRK